MAVVTPKIWNFMDTMALGTGVDRDALTKLPNGGYVVTWRENEKIAFQLYDGNGVKAGAKGFVDTPITSQQFSDVVTYTADGGFAITWTEGTGTTGRILRVQKFNFDGSVNGAATTINTTTQFDGAQMSANGSGGWATAYIENSGNGNTVLLTQFSADGIDEGTVSVSSGNSVGRPDVTWVGGTKYAVSYLNSDGTSIRIVDTSNSTVSSAATLFGSIEGKVVALKAANGQPSGEFVVVTNAGQLEPILVQKYSADPATGVITAVGTPVTISPAQNPALPSAGDKVSVTALRDGGYAIAYVSTASGNPDIWVKVVDANGQLGPAINVSAEAGLQTMPSIFEMADGRLAVSWHNPSHPTHGAGIETKIVDARAAAVSVTGTIHNDIYAPSAHSGDDFNGGDGIDTLTFKGAGAGVTVNLATESGSAGDAAGDTYKNFENIIGSSYNDGLTGNAVSNTLQGGSGNDVLNGLEGADRMEGGLGNDIYYVDNPGDLVIDTSTGIDTVYTSISHALTSYVEYLYATGTSAVTLTGNTLSNRLYGNTASNTLNGGTGNDTLSGGNGADKLYGGAGVDYLYGGTDTGRDIFVFNTALNSSSNKDFIKDWNKTYDTIHLENAVFKVLKGPLSASMFKIAAAATDANDYVGYNKATGNLWYDYNGNKAGGQIFFANIGANKAIAYNDFVII